ncbi:MAG: 6-bladed beta-propeller [Sedimentibacter sp.]|nr:6-bladed beta-propeller [Sedimentibacter sp.]
MIISRNRNSFAIILIILLTILSCKESHKVVIPIQGIETIDIIGSYESKGEVKLSSIADSVEYIKLESSDKCMVSNPYLVAARDSILILIEYQKILVFNRVTGAFKYEISTFGRGPSEYRSTQTNGYDELNNLVYVSSFNEDNIMGFSTDGSLQIMFKKPGSNYEIKGKEYNIGSFWPFARNQYIGYSENISGINPVKLERFNTSGRILYQYPNYNFFDKNKHNGSYREHDDGWFFCYTDSIRFFEMYTDTIYTVLDKKLYPRYLLKMGELSPPYYLMSVDVGLDFKHFDYFHIRKIFESPRFLFFTLRLKNYRHLCFYDKKLKETKVCEVVSDKEHYEVQTTYENIPRFGRVRWEKETRTIGLVDDINNFIPFGVGNKCIYINRNNELIAYIQASDVERWFKMNPDKVKNLPENLKKYSEVKATDNIIVMVIKLIE